MASQMALGWDSDMVSKMVFDWSLDMSFEMPTGCTFIGQICCEEIDDVELATLLLHSVFGLT